MERTDWLAPGPWKMANPVGEYHWASTGALAALQGREPLAEAAVVRFADTQPTRRIRTRKGQRHLPGFPTVR